VTKTTIRRPLLMVAAVLIFAAVGIGLAADGGFQGREDDERDHDGDRQTWRVRDWTVHWVNVVVDARSRDVFTYQPQIVPANRTAVPAP
jgi:hypothetical protein